MKTYITLWFSSEGESPTGVVGRLKEIGFKPVYGNYDMVYDWGSNSSIDNIIKLADMVKKRLSGTKTLFKLETL